MQFAQILARALPDTELAAQNNIPDGSIPDILVSSEAAPDIYLLYRAGVMTGSDSQGSFLPAANIRRCEVAAIISRMVIPSLRKSLSLTVPAPGTRVIASGDCSSIDVNVEGQDRFFELGRHKSTCTWTLTDDGTLTIEGNGPIEKVYFYGDAPKWGKLAICNIGSGESAPASAQPTLYYIEGAAGFTSPTWTAPDGTVYQTATFDPAQIPFD